MAGKEIENPLRCGQMIVPFRLLAWASVSGGYRHAVAAAGTRHLCIAAG